MLPNAQFQCAIEELEPILERGRQHDAIVESPGKSTLR